MPVTATTAELEDAMVAALRRCHMDEFERLAAMVEQADDDRRRRLAAGGAIAAAATWYAAQGVAVFPVEERAKVPLVRWRDAATVDAAQIEAWWRRWPQANIGMPTGMRWDVIDIDGPPGYQSFGTIRDAGRLPPVLARSFTPRGGMHIFITPTGSGNGASLGPGLDYRGIGGYVVLPPSHGSNGRQYEWVEAPVVA
jgi:hypothetical protein